MADEPEVKVQDSDEREDSSGVKKAEPVEGHSASNGVHEESGNGVGKAAENLKEEEVEKQEVERDGVGDKKKDEEPQEKKEEGAEKKENGGDGGEAKKKEKETERRSEKGKSSPDKRSREEKGEADPRESRRRRDGSRSPGDRRGDRGRDGGGSRSGDDRHRRDASRSERRGRSRERDGSSRRDRDRDRPHHQHREGSSRKRRDRSYSSSRSRSRSSSRDRKRKSSRHQHRSSRRRSRSQSSASSRSPSPLVRRKEAGDKASTEAPPAKRTGNWDRGPDTTAAGVPPQPPQTSTAPHFVPTTYSSIPINMTPVTLAPAFPGAVASYPPPPPRPALGTPFPAMGGGGMPGFPAAAILGNLMQASNAIQQQQQQQGVIMINNVPVTPQVMRQARRLYIGNVPMGATEATLSALFNNAMVASGKGQAEAPPVIAVQMEPGKSFAFLELRTPEDATNALLFDGISYGANFLKLRRPKDYKPLPGMAPDPPVGGAPLIRGVVSTSVADSENKVYLGGIPSAFNEVQVRELVSAFGELKAFNLIKDSVTGVSKGYAFFEYLDHSVTDRVCTELNEFELGGRKLTCQRANAQGTRAAQQQQAALAGMAGLIGYNPLMAGALTGAVGAGLTPGFGIPGLAVPQVQATRVIKLSNMILPTELVDDEEYEEIVSDIREEAAKYGIVVSLKVPRPLKLDNGQVVNGQGVGQVYVEYANVEGAKAGEAALRNRHFSGRVVVASFYPEADYAQENLS